MRMSPPPEVLQYAGTLPPHEIPSSVTAGVAIALSAVGLCLPPVAILGFMFGIVALVLYRNDARRAAGRRLALAAVFLPLAEVLVLAILLPSLARVRELALRTCCAANLSGIGKGLQTYADDGNQGWPIAAHWVEQVATGTGQVKYVGRMGSKRGVTSRPAAGESFAVDGPDGREISTTRNLWTLVRARGSTPASFIWPGGEDMKNMEDNPQDYWDFGDGDVPLAGPLPVAQNEKAYRQCSYGYQVPYGRFGRPGGNYPKMVLVADKGPYGLAAEAFGKTPPPAFPSKLNARSRLSAWQPWNSPNHEGEGQDVLFADGHSEFRNTPLAGIDDDNIYTQWSSPQGGEGQRISGNAPSRSAPNLTPQSDTDSLIYP